MELTRLILHPISSRRPPLTRLWALRGLWTARSIRRPCVSCPRQCRSERQQQRRYLLGVTTTNAALGAYNTSKEAAALAPMPAGPSPTSTSRLSARLRWQRNRRYGAAQLSDLSIHADGTPHLIKGFQVWARWNGTQETRLYAYTGVEYAGRRMTTMPICRCSRCRLRASQDCICMN